MPTWDNVWLTILAGGRGSRFWPLSQSEFPKQFLSIPPIAEDVTLIQATLTRLAEQIPLSRVLIVGLKEHAKHFKQQLKELPPANLILEPMGRNTAASIAVAAQRTLELGGVESVQVVLPADHHIGDAKLLEQTVASALETLQQNDKLLTFGIVPRWPETGYGYIELGEQLGVFERLPVHHATSFREKPNLEKAQEYLRAGNYLWNSGMFVWKSETILAEFRQHLPKVTKALAKLPKPKAGSAWNIPTRIYEPLENISIDFGIMEHSKRVAVVCTSMVWSDLGGWESVYQLLPKDPSGNVVRAKSSLLHNSKDSLFYANDLQIIADGIEGFVIAYHNGRLLICRRERVSEIRKLVEQMPSL